MQLEEANRTLTSDVANLANEKEELNNKLKAAMEGCSPSHSSHIVNQKKKKQGLGCLGEFYFIPSARIPKVK